MVHIQSICSIFQNLLKSFHNKAPFLCKDHSGLFHLISDVYYIEPTIYVWRFRRCSRINLLCLWDQWVSVIFEKASVFAVMWKLSRRGRRLHEYLHNALFFWSCLQTILASCGSAIPSILRLYNWLKVVENISLYILHFIGALLLR